MKTDFLLVVGARIAPGIAELDSAARDRVAETIARAIAARPAVVQRQFALFLALLHWSPLARYGRPFDRLPPLQQDAVLRWFCEAPIARLRQGFWGVKTLVYMGYYGLPEVTDRVGYRPSRSGNSFLHAR